jgi:membrane-associated phospholipid phosphatase
MTWTTLAWHWITRLGEAQVLLPAMAISLLHLVAQRATQPMARWWVMGLAAAASLTTLSKLAFIGFGMGIAALNFTGFSGHSLLSAAVLPWLLALPLRRPGQAWRARSLLPGAVLALQVAVSRVQLGAHSWSEVILGGLLGAAVTWGVLRQQAPARPSPGLAPWMAFSTLACMLALPLLTRPLPTQDWMTTAALKISGHSRPYTRAQMRRDWLHTRHLA